MARLFSIALWVLAASAASAQSPADRPHPPATSGGGQIREAPPVGGAGIPKDLRSNATKDIPMGDGKPKGSAPAAGTDKRGK
jgi:hypothetical protein